MSLTVELFSAGAFDVQSDVAADRQHFLIPMLPIGDVAEPIRVTLNWRPGGQQAR